MESLKHLGHDLCTLLPQNDAGMFIPAGAAIIQNCHWFAHRRRSFDKTQAGVRCKCRAYDKNRVSMRGQVYGALRYVLWHIFPKENN